MANFFNILNRKIIINSSKISNPSLKDAIILNSERVTGDLSSIASYNNQVIYEVFRKLCSKPEYPFDVVESGLSGNTVVTYLEEDGNNSFNSPIYWSQDQNRPNTIKESFDYVISNLGIQEVIRENESPDLGNIIAQIRCTQKNLNKLRKDTIGCNDEYFSCSDQPELEWPISKHLYELFTQGIISGHNEALIADLDNICDTAGTEYPDLKLTIKTDGIEQGVSLIPQRFIEGCQGEDLEIQLDQIQDFIGMECNENLAELATCASLQIANQRSLKAYIEKILERLCSLGEEGIDAVYLGVRNPEIGKDGNVEDIVVEPATRPLRAGSALSYFHSVNEAEKKHFYLPSGQESFVEGIFVPDGKKGYPSWDDASVPSGSYTNPIPYTLFSYSNSNDYLSVDFANLMGTQVSGKRLQNRYPTVCLFEEVHSHIDNSNVINYAYNQIGGVIRNDLTVADREKDSAVGITKYTDKLNDYHVSNAGNNYLNHLQISGHTPIICIGAVGLGDTLVPAPVKLLEAAGFPSGSGYGIVCSWKTVLANTSYFIGLGYSSISELYHKVGVALSTTYVSFNTTQIQNSPLAQVNHEDVVNNIINKAKLNFVLPFPTDVNLILSIQQMRIMLWRFA